MFKQSDPQNENYQIKMHHHITKFSITCRYKEQLLKRNGPIHKHTQFQIASKVVTLKRHFLNNLCFVG